MNQQQNKQVLFSPLNGIEGIIKKAARPRQPMMYQAFLM
jgi:hypothetical protein